MISTAARRDVVRIAPFGVIWLFFGLVFLFVEWASGGGQFPVSDTVIVPDTRILVFAVAAMGVLGLLFGYLEFKLMDGWFAGSSLGARILYKFVIYFVLVHLIVVVTFPIAAALEIDSGVLDPRVWEKLGDYLVSLDHLNTVVQLSVVILVSLVYGQVSGLIGHSTLLSYLSGRYHRPVEEERIFMFLDMKGSTTLTETLGNRRYFDLLRKYYADLAPAVIKYGGELYQYVGDEMIISWRYADPAGNADCLRCYFAMRRALAERAADYRKQFGVVPEFKAGLHCGSVLAGEIGVVKKEITFSGDVLNATARIQALCNALNSELLISAAVAERIVLPPEWEFKPLGTHRLRGKEEEVTLYGIDCV